MSRGEIVEIEERNLWLDERLAPAGWSLIKLHLVVAERRTAEMLARVTEVLKIVNRANAQNVDGIVSLLAPSLPSWFVKEFGVESEERKPKGWAKIQGLLMGRKSVSHDEVGWTLHGWSYWMEVSRRTWFWHSGCAVNSACVQVILLVEEEPCPIGAFNWLAQCAGSIGTTTTTLGHPERQE